MPSTSGPIRGFVSVFFLPVEGTWCFRRTWMSRWKLGSMVRINGLFHLSGIYWGYNLLTNRYPPAWRVKKGPFVCRYIWIPAWIYTPEIEHIPPEKYAGTGRLNLPFEMVSFQVTFVNFHGGWYIHLISIQPRNSPGWLVFCCWGSLKRHFLLKMLKGDFDVTLDVFTNHTKEFQKISKYKPGTQTCGGRWERKLELMWVVLWHKALRNTRRCAHAPPWHKALCTGPPGWHKALRTGPPQGDTRRCAQAPLTNTMRCALALPWHKALCTRPALGFEPMTDR